MNESDKREKLLAEHLIAQSASTVYTWVDRQFIDREDADAAILAALVKAVQIQANMQGLPIDRLLREIS